jgi:hypothetical protein
MNCPSVYLQSKYGRMTRFLSEQNCSNRRKFAHTKEKLLTKIRFAQSKNLLKKFAHSRNLLTEFARSIEKLHRMKNLAGSDGSTRWLNVLHQANRSTAGAHHSTVSVVTAGTCWAGPSCYVIGRVQLYSRTWVLRVHTRRFRNICFRTNFSFAITAFSKTFLFFWVPQRWQAST